MHVHIRHMTGGFWNLMYMGTILNHWMMWVVKSLAMCMQPH